MNNTSQETGYGGRKFQSRTVCSASGQLSLRDTGRDILPNLYGPQFPFEKVQWIIDLCCSFNDPLSSLLSVHPGESSVPSQGSPALKTPIHKDQRPTISTTNSKNKSYPTRPLARLDKTIQTRVQLDKPHSSGINNLLKSRSILFKIFSCLQNRKTKLLDMLSLGFHIAAGDGIEINDTKFGHFFVCRLGDFFHQSFVGGFEFPGCSVSTICSHHRGQSRHCGVNVPVPVIS